MKRNRLLQIILFSTIVIYCSIFAKSCANTTGAPTGGPKDTIPPILVNVVPALNELNVPLTKNTIQLYFNEYVVLKDATNQIFLSPPTSKKPQTRVRGKSIIITVEDTLRQNTTYTIDFGAGIVDNNEGNVFPQYVYTFSTGGHVDSLYFTGNIVNAATMLPEKGVTIALYMVPADSTADITTTPDVMSKQIISTLKSTLPIHSTPDKMTRSDSWGFFTLRNLQDTLYYVYAFNDLNFNYKYDQESEKIAFLDSAFRPSKVIAKDIKELLFVGDKDTVAAMERVPDVNMFLFKEHPSRQYLSNSGRIAERAAFIKFSAPYVIIDTIEMEKYDNSKIITQFNTLQDSLLIWINDQKPIPDTLLVNMTYHKTDSTGVLTPFEESVKLILKRTGESAQTGQSRRYTRTDDSQRDTTLKFTAKATPETVDQDGITLQFDYPLIRKEMQNITLSYQTPRLQTIQETYTILYDATDIRRFIIKPDKPLVAGNDYILKVPKDIFTDINGLPNDSLNVKFALPNSENLSSISLILEDVTSHYIVELINEKRDQVFRSYRIDSDTTLSFPYLKAMKYSIRITEDKNNNGIIDTGSLLERRQPEKVLLYKPGEGMTDAAYILDIPERAEIIQTINIGEMFR